LDGVLVYSPGYIGMYIVLTIISSVPYKLSYDRLVEDLKDGAW